MRAIDHDGLSFPRFEWIVGFGRSLEAQSCGSPFRGTKKLVDQDDRSHSQQPNFRFVEREAQLVFKLPHGPCLVIGHVRDFCPIREKISGNPVRSIELAVSSTFRSSSGAF